MPHISFKTSSQSHFILTLIMVVICSLNVYSQNSNTKSVVNIVFTSDAHYGITRAKFRGDTNVPGYRVNAAMISQINTLPSLTLPAGKTVGAIDYVIEGGDIANRMEVPIQSAAISWGQFEKDYMHS
ncbi:MAG: hypothetical protein JWR67_727, partial [Mucilaginibacter sp.]|nr:hypothetical protein [Mucilaginibacter sp.]